MPRKKVNGNIIGARWQDIRLCGEIIAVNRRIGGLESGKRGAIHLHMVNRRIGGLEKMLWALEALGVVNRRIGGLETGKCDRSTKVPVNRRIGGLENKCKSITKI